MIRDPTTAQKRQKPGLLLFRGCHLLRSFRAALAWIVRYGFGRSHGLLAASCAPITSPAEKAGL
jgi:hypothetical protein